MGLVDSLAAAKGTCSNTQVQFWTQEQSPSVQVCQNMPGMPTQGMPRRAIPPFLWNCKATQHQPHAQHNASHSVLMECLLVWHRHGTNTVEKYLHTVCSCTQFATMRQVMLCTLIRHFFAPMLPPPHPLLLLPNARHTCVVSHSG